MAQHKIGKIPKIRKIYDFKQLSSMTDDEIKEKCRGFTIKNENIETIDITALQRYLKLISEENNKYNIIICDDYGIALLIKKLVEKNNSLKINQIRLLDDYKMKDRSYIDCDSFKELNIDLVVPTTYIMWNVHFKDTIQTNNQVQYENGTSESNFETNNINSTGTIQKKDLTEFIRIIEMMASFPENLTSVEKIIILANYIERYCQFIHKRITDVEEDKFILEDESILENSTSENPEALNLSNPLTALLERYGVCRTFANAMTLLLNNPIVRVNARTISGHNHAWNVIELNDKLYQLDVSRCITRGKDRDENNLKALKFNKDYILFGEDFSDSVGHEKKRCYLPKPLERESFNKDYIEAAYEHLKDTGLIVFDYSNEPIPYKQRKQ